MSSPEDNFLNKSKLVAFSLKSPFSEKYNHPKTLSRPPRPKAETSKNLNLIKKDKKVSLFKDSLSPKVQFKKFNLNLFESEQNLPSITDNYFVKEDNFIKNENIKRNSVTKYISQSGLVKPRVCKSEKNLININIKEELDQDKNSSICPNNDHSNNNVNVNKKASTNVTNTSQARKSGQTRNKALAFLRMCFC
jgi:hypothetical protein